MKNRPKTAPVFYFKKRPRKKPVERVLRQGMINESRKNETGLKTQI